MQGGGQGESEESDDHIEEVCCRMCNAVVCVCV